LAKECDQFRHDVIEGLRKECFAHHLQEPMLKLLTFLSAGDDAAVGGLSDDLLQRRVLHGVPRARGGFAFAQNVAAYVTLMFVVAPGFDEASHLAGWLTADDGERDAAFERLHRDTTGAEWLAARAAWQAQTERAPWVKCQTFAGLAFIFQFE
jgi:hypothetical protein